MAALAAIRFERLSGGQLVGLPYAWEEAERVVGEPTVAVAVVAILERSREIRSPDGWLRELTSEVEAGAFRVGSVLMALLSRKGQEAKKSP